MDDSPAKTSIRRTVQTFAAFLPMAALGTGIHEGGHYLVAALFGGHPTLHYGWIDWEDDGRAGTTTEALVTAAGPMANMLLGTLGLFWLSRLGPTSRATLPAIALALFWSRQPFILAGLIAARLVTGGVSPEGDEVRLGLVYAGGAWPIAVVTGVLGAAACVATLALTPRPWRIPLVLGGVPGCLVGFAVWYGVLGPNLLP